jgi:hypothetical protein
MPENRLGWRVRLALPSLYYSRRVARRVTQEALTALGNENQLRPVLHARAEKNAPNLANIPVPEPMKSLLFSPDAMMSHPFLAHHIRPAKRFAAAAGHDVSHIPIVASSRLTFGGEAIELEPSCLKIAEIPLGLVFLFRELALGILNLHNALEYNQAQEIERFSKACALLACLIFLPAPISFTAGQIAFKKMPLKYRLYASQTMQILTGYVLLHEMGHICLNHNLDPSEIERKDQELAADVFAMRCMFAPKLNAPSFALFRKIQIINVCHLLTLLEYRFADGGDLAGYPTFAERRSNLLNSFEGTDSVDASVKRSIAAFEKAVQKAPRFDLQNLEQHLV